MLTPSLNTLAFPSWNLAEVVGFAHQNNVSYIEIRALENNLDLLSAPDFATPARLAQSRLLLHTANVRILSLNLGFRLSDDLTEHADTIRRYADLADSLGAPYLRFFAGGKPEERPDVNELAKSTLLAINLLAHNEVELLVETHDSLVHSDDILALNECLGGHLNLLWDIAHTANYGGERWQETFQRLEQVTCYLHVKDTRKTDQGIQNVLLYEGDLNVRDLLTFFAKRPDEMIVSFEWEKMWHPELQDGDAASLDFLSKIRSVK